MLMLRQVTIKILIHRIKQRNAGNTAEGAYRLNTCDATEELRPDCSDLGSLLNPVRSNLHELINTIKQIHKP